MPSGYTKTALRSVDRNSQKPGERRELSDALGVDAFNYNVATLAPGERLSENAYHYHEDQAEFFHVLDGEVRVEVPDDSFDLGTDELIHFEEGVTHLLHNVSDAPCRLVGIGYPPEGRYPVHQVQSYEELLADRYPDGETATPSTEP